MRFKRLEKVSFRASERTNFDAITRGKVLAKGDVVVLLSHSEDQLTFVYGYEQLGDGALVLGSRRMRLVKGTWDVTRLRDYAERVDLEINDWTVFDRALRKAKRVLTRVARGALKAA